MAYVFASSVLAGEASASFTQPIPEHAANDILLAILTQDVGGTAIAVSGWTEIGTQSQNQAQRTAAFWKLASSSSEADLSATGHNDEWIGSIIVIRGANTTTPIHQNNRTNSANSTTAYLDSGTVTTTESNTLLIYAWGFDNTGRLIPENPSHIVGLTKNNDAGCIQITGYRNQIGTGTSQVVRALSEVASEGGTALVIAVSDATPSTPQMGPFITNTYEMIARYGGGISPTASTSTFGRHDSSSTSFENAEGLGATTIDGIDLLDLTVTYGSASVPAILWGSGSQFNVSGSAIDSTGRWAGGVLPVSPTVDLTDKTFFVEWALSGVGTQLGNKGAIIVFESSSSDWAAFTLSVKSGISGSVLYPTFIDVRNVPPLDSGGTIDWSAINKMAYLYHRVSTSTVAQSIRFRNAGYIEKTTIVDGCQADPVSSTFLSNLGFWDVNGLATLQGTGQLRTTHTIEIGDGSRPTYSDFLGVSTETPLGFGSSLRRRFWNVEADSPNARIVVNAGANDTVKFNNCLAATDLSQELIIESGSSSLADYDFSGSVILGWKVTNNVTGVSIDSATLSGRLITLNGGGLEDSVISDPFQSPALITNNPGHILGCDFISPGTGHAIEITATGTFDFLGNTFSGYGADGSTDAALYNNSGGLVTLTIDGTTPTVRNGAGASTTFIAPTPTLTITGLINACEIRLYDLDSSDPGFLGTELAGEETLSGTTFEYIHSGTTNTIWVQVIATGYEEFGQSFVLGATDQSLFADLRPEVNI